MHVFYVALTALIGMNSAAWAANHDPRAIGAALPNARISLLEGIAMAEQAQGPAISAKFEIDSSGRLILSVYNVPEGLAVAPESATLSEVSFVATDSQPTASVAVFGDKEHIARAASHMTLFQISRLTLGQVINKAVLRRAGTPIDVRNPTVRNHRPVADVVLLDRVGEPFIVTVDLVNGRAFVE